MCRDLFNDEHDSFCAEVRRFAETEIVPQIAWWNQRAIREGGLCLMVGEADFPGANASGE